MRRSLLALVVLGCVDALAGCSNDALRACPPTSLQPAVEVEVRDSATDALLTSGSRGAVRDGEFVDSLRPWRFDGETPVTLGAAFGRAGRYDVTVEHPGYERWEQHDVRSFGGGCSAGTSALVARLEARP